MSRTTTTTIETNLTEQHEVWQAGRDAVPEDVRERCARILSEGDVTTRAHINKKLQQIMGELLMGNVPPLVSQQLMEWMQLLMVNIHAQHVDAGTERLAGRDIVVALGDVFTQAKPVQTYIVGVDEYRQLPGLVEAEELEKVAVERQTG